MATISSIPAPLPVAETPQRPVEARGAQVLQRDVAAPVARTDQSAAVQQAAAKPGAGNAALLTACATAETSALAAAEAAREAYIRASIAAGINLLPLP
jgi:hypothetical protein